MRLYNSLTREIEDFSPRKDGEVGVYTCGPTVYDTATVGNFRTNVLADILVRTLRYLDYRVKHVMNITDVGHLTGDNEGDASQGEDRLEKGAKREGKTAWEVAGEYAGEFVRHMKMLNIVRPDELPRATEHIGEQVEMIKSLEAKGYTYKISDGVYFDTKKYEEMGNTYGELSTLDQIREGARVKKNEEKKNERDFALWKFSHNDGESFDSTQDVSLRRDMEWDSPWGVGFPGWHIECSAMSKKYLGEQFDIHVGGEDLRSTHHPNEIAQSEGVSGKKPFVKYWMHGAFLLVDGGKMGKSLGNAYTVEDVVKRDYDPVVLRYFYLGGSYRKQLNFTWEAMNASTKALGRLRVAFHEFSIEKERTTLSPEKLEKVDECRRMFEQSIENDLDMPGALAVVWEVVKSNIPGYDKADLLRSFDRVLGLGLTEWKPKKIKTVSVEAKALIKKRDELRTEKKYKEADAVKGEIEELGYQVEDTAEGTVVK